MNVVHLDIVINIAYGKLSMKVYDIIIQEADWKRGTINVARRMIGLGRSFDTKAAEYIVDKTTRDLADEIYRLGTTGKVMSKSDLENFWKVDPVGKNNFEELKKIFGDTKSPDYLSPKATQELSDEMVQAAKKEADSRLKSSGINTTSTSTGRPGVVKQVASKITLNGVWNAAKYAGIFSAAAFTDAGPIHVYFERRKIVSHKLEIGPDGEDTLYPEWAGGKGITQEEYDKYLYKQQWVMIIGLAPYVVPISGLLGAALAGGMIGSNGFDILKGSATSLGAAFLLKRFVPKGWNIANKALAAAWFVYLAKNPKIPYTAGLNEVNPNEDLTLQQALSALALSETLDFLPKINESIEKGLREVADDANQYVMKLAGKQSSQPTTSTVKPTTTSPSVKPAKTTTDTTNTTLPENPTVFHPNEWVLRNATYQYKGPGKHTLSSWQFKQLTDGEALVLKDGELVSAVSATSN